MFEHLPVVSEATNKAFWNEMDEFEAGEIANEMKERMGVLVVNNEYLAKAILSFAQVVAAKFEGETKYRVEADTTIALLATLSMIDRELEELEERN